MKINRPEDPGGVGGHAGKRKKESIYQKKLENNSMRIRFNIKLCA